MAEELVITVASKTPKKNGGFDIVDSEGKKYTLAVKNAGKESLLIPGRASKIKIAKTDFGWYINDAELFDPSNTGVAQTTRPSNPPQPSKPTEPIKSSLAREAQSMNTEILRMRSMALSYAKDMVVAGKEEPEVLYDVADAMLSWMINNK